MKIRVNKYIAEDKFFIEISTESFSQDDLDLMAKFGEPQVNVGGTYDSGNGYALPNCMKSVRQDFQPYKTLIDGQTYSNAAARATTLAAYIVTNIQNTMTTLRALSDTFTGESVTNY